MGLMRIGLIATILVISTSLLAEPAVSGAFAKVRYLEGRLVVRQSVTFDDLQKETVEFKALHFDGVAISNITLIEPVGGAMEVISDGGLTRLLLRSTNADQQRVTLQYDLSRGVGEVALPLFYSDVPADNSESSFCRLELVLPATIQYRIHFPSVPVEERENDTERIVNLELPAIPSMIRVEMSNQPSTATWPVVWVDRGVAMVFLLIGLLIWFNRKRFIYG